MGSGRGREVGVPVSESTMSPSGVVIPIVLKSTDIPAKLRVPRSGAWTRPVSHRGNHRSAARGQDRKLDAEGAEGARHHVRRRQRRAAHRVDDAVGGTVLVPVQERDEARDEQRICAGSNVVEVETLFVG